MPPPHSERGQASVEWVGLVGLLALLMAALVGALGLAGELPGLALARTVAEKLVCAAHLGDGCGGSPIGGCLRD